MAESKLRKAWKNEYIQTGILIAIIVVVIFGLWFGSQIVLRTPYPALAVASGSMCEPYYMHCDGWSHPFERTLHTGDLIIVQGINGKDVKTGWDPEGDIIIFHRPKGSERDVDELIVHRAIANLTYNGLIYFETRGDGSYTPSGDHWTDYRGENYTYEGYVSENLLVGKVIMRIPWLGHISQYMRNSSAIYIIIILLVLLVIVEFVFPILTHKKPEEERAEEKPPSPEKPPKT